jgi:hypothetical protein
MILFSEQKKLSLRIGQDSLELGIGILNDWGDRGGGDPQTAFEAWIAGIENKYKKHTFKEKINNHPKYIKGSLLSLEDNQFGYDVFGLKNNTSFKLIDIAKGYKLKKLYKLRRNNQC